MGELDTYRSKRHFDKTPEPSGTSASTDNDSAVYFIHKHAARALHYDLRLEIDGVLVSWAVPKGPSLDTHDKRLAVRVEDHPMEYGPFEGAIPEGEYGAGTVMLWDRGGWKPNGEMSIEDQMANGHLKLQLNGVKLNGDWALVRMKSREGEKRENWLLIKERDDNARPHEEYDILEARPESVASGRNMDQIAAGNDATPLTTSGREAAVEEIRATSGAIRGPLPSNAPMQMAQLVEIPPEGPEWIHEIKYDGYRLRCAVEGGHATLLTRNGKDWTDRFERIARAVTSLPVESALLDGEVVVFGRNGVPDFGALQHALSMKRMSKAVYMAFDLLYMDGWDLREIPLRKRKELLHVLLESADANPPIRYVEHIDSRGRDFHREACTLALEGSVSKRADSPYVGDRNRDWQKVKCLLRQEFVVGGFTEGQGGRQGFGALLLGTYDETGELHHAGSVGTGFSETDLVAIRAKLDNLTTSASPFATSPDLHEHTVHWVRPLLVAEISFQEWTHDGAIRHPSFLGMRQDRSPESIRKEIPDPAEEIGGHIESPIKIAGVKLTKPAKVLYPKVGTPDAGITKLDLARYYERVAEQMLAYVAMRPLTLVRCPHGSAKGCFYQKHPEKAGAPETLKTVQITDRKGPATYLYADSVSGLVALAQMGALEIHTWNSIVGEPEKPDQIVFDLDPGPGLRWSDVLEASRIIRDALGALGLTGFAKTTGGNGLHVVVPIKPTLRYNRARAVTRAFVDRMAEYDSAAFTAKMAKGARSGRVFIDYLRNAHGATAIAPFSTRARDGAPVSVPVTWEELEGGLDPMSFDITTVPERITSLTENPWAGFDDVRVELGDPIFAALGLPRQEELDE